MPEISRFFGLVVFMYYNDHPPPHVHVRYGSSKARFDISTAEVLSGSLTPRAEGLVREWIVWQRAALVEDWELARRQEPLKPVPPLE